MRVKTDRQVIDYSEADKFEVSNADETNLLPIKSVLTGTVTYDPINLVDGAGETKAVTVTGAALGDHALWSFTVDVEEITVSAAVSAADTVEVRFQNETGGTLNIASGTLRASVIKL